MLASDHLLYDPESDTFYVNLDQVDTWHTRLKHENHNVIVIENERYTQLSNEIDSGKRLLMMKIPIYKEVDGSSADQAVSFRDDDNSQLIKHDCSKSKITALFSMLCFGFIFFDCLFIIKKYYDGAFMFTIFAVISAFIMVISAFMFLVYWAYGSDEK